MSPYDTQHPGDNQVLNCEEGEPGRRAKKKNKSGVDCTMHSMQSCDAEIIISEYYN